MHTSAPHDSTIGGANHPKKTGGGGMMHFSANDIVAARPNRKQIYFKDLRLPKKRQLEPAPKSR
jgi:hypothetical protein